jgi:hypothetical protein
MHACAVCARARALHDFSLRAVAWLVGACSRRLGVGPCHAFCAWPCVPVNAATHGSSYDASAYYSPVDRHLASLAIDSRSGVAVSIRLLLHAQAARARAYGRDTRSDAAATLLAC